MTPPTSDDVQRFDLAFCVPDMTEGLEPKLRAIADLGITHVGWEDLPWGRAESDMLAAHGLSVVTYHMVGGIAPPSDDAADAALNRNRAGLDRAAEIGSPSVVWHFRWIQGGPDGRSSTPEQIAPYSHAELDRLTDLLLGPTCDYAATLGITVNVENLPVFPWCRDAYAVLNYVKQQGLPNFRFVLDSGHAWVSDQDPGELVQQAGEYLGDTHFHDCLGSRGFDFNGPATQQHITPGRDLHLIPGLGTINWLDVVRALRHIGYARPVVFEAPGIKGHPDHGPEQWARAVDLTVRMWRAMEELASYCPPPFMPAAGTPSDDRD